MAAHPNHHSSHLRSQAKDIVFNVHEYFQKEKDYGGPTENVSKVNYRTALATKVSERTVKRICSEGKVNQENDGATFTSPKKRQRATPVMDFFDNFNEGVLHRTVLSFYARHEIPTVETIYREMQNTLSYPGSKTTLRRVLKKIGFTYARVDGRKCLMERDDVTHARIVFLNEMRKIKNEDKNIVYLDETWINQNYTVSKCWTDGASQKPTGLQVPTGKGSRLIIVHAGTKHGFVPGAAHVFQAKNDGDYHQQMNAETFEDWFVTKLLPNIPPSSAIVLDNASYHSRKIHKPPTTSSNKSAIRQWLEEKGVTVQDGLLKSQLLHLVYQHVNANDTNYVVDKIASEHGHRVVRLPPYHCQYNPIELIWAQVKGYVAKRNKFKIATLKDLTQEALHNVTGENWKNAVTHAEKIQDDDTARDIVIDHFVDSFIISLTSDDDSS